MAQRPNTPPRFGEWDGQDAQYTAYFEEERRLRDPRARQKILDPNDPQRNPYAALASRQVAVPRNEIRANDSNGEGNLYAPELTTHARGRKHSAVNSGDEGGGYNQVHKQGSSKTPSQGNYSGNSSPWDQRSTRAANVRKIDDNQRVASVPVFGAWNGESSTEGYSMIFDKLKEEKTGTASRQPSVSKSPESGENQDVAKKTRNTSAKIKMCFCFAS